MKRVVAILGLMALAIVVGLVIRPEGATAIAFSFAGLPLLGCMLVAWSLARRFGGD